MSTRATCYPHLDSGRTSLAWLYRALFAADDVVDAVRGLPPWIRFALPVCGATAAGVIAFFRSVPAQGVSNVMEAVALGNVRLSLRTTVSRVLASWAAIAAGMSIGREGPLIEFGGSLGATFSRVLGVSLDRTRVLVAAGTAAGFAAAYNTPFAAVLFVLETIIGIAALEALLPAMAATVIATALTRAVVGGGPIYGQRAFVLQSAADLVWFGTLGLAAAVAAACFKGLLSQFEQTLQRHPLPQPWRAALGGVAVGAIAIWIPEVAGNGYEPLNALLNQQLAVGVLIVSDHRESDRHQCVGGVRRSRWDLHGRAAGRWCTWHPLGACSRMVRPRHCGEYRQLCSRRDGGDNRGEHPRAAHGGRARLRTLR